MRIDVSLGELVDKTTILAIKKMKVRDPRKLANIEKEHAHLHAEMTGTGINEDSELYRRLLAVNLKLWDIEDRIRIKEREKAFDAEFIELARSVYFRNDERADIKREINLRFESDLIEEKEYVDYRGNGTAGPGAD